MTESAIRYEKDNHNIVTLILDDPNQSANTMNAAYKAAISDVINRLEAEKEHVAGILITSAKKTFFAGGDLNDLIQVTEDDAEAFMADVTKLKETLRRLETLGVPVVACINGAAMGGGLEIALAAHHRIILDDPRIPLGLPEVTLGLLPGAGGVVRAVRMLGLEKALPFLMEGQQLNPQKALKMGIVDELASSVEDMLEKGRAWIATNPDAQQPWDSKGYRIPGGDPSSPKVAQMLAIAPAMLRDKTKGCYPAPEAIMCAAVEGAQVDFDTALRIESRYFIQLATGQVAKNMISAFFFQLQEIKKGASRPAGYKPWQPSKVGVLGAGMMGSGIAWACANSGIDVVLKDLSLASAEKGKSYSASLLEKRVAKGRMDQAKADAILSRITPTENAEDLAGCDMIIEAVFEDRELKANVTKEAESQVQAGVLMCSNTSTLPITGLATASEKPENFIGLHFFSPVDKMPLVEIIRGEKTSDETLAKAFDFVLRIKKTPIVVNDSRGFFTSRVFGTFAMEGVAMLGEHIDPNTIEKAALLAGMPVGPLAVVDEVTLSLSRNIRMQTIKDLAAEGKAYVPHPADAIIDKMVTEFGRESKVSGKGFYDYPEGQPKRLWPGLKEHFGGHVHDVPMQDLKDRILFIQAIEAVKCVEEGVLNSATDANIGSIFGIGMPAWTGGVLQFINGYGLSAFVARTKALAEKYGDRFQPPALLVQKAEAGEQFE